MELKTKKSLVWVLLVGLLYLSWSPAYSQDDAVMDEVEVVEEAMPEEAQPAVAPATEEIIEESESESNNSATPAIVPSSDESAASESYDIED